MSAYYMTIFDVVTREEDAPSDVAAALAAPVLFASLSYDGKIYAGHWRIIDHAPVSRTTRLPAYRVAIGAPPRPYIEDFFAIKRRRASRKEARALPERGFVSPAVLERALRAHHGMEPWLPAFDDLALNQLAIADRFATDA
jgi:hypothetical protein